MVRLFGDTVASGDDVRDGRLPESSDEENTHGVDASDEAEEFFNPLKPYSSSRNKKVPGKKTAMATADSSDVDPGGIASSSEDDAEAGANKAAGKQSKKTPVKLPGAASKIASKFASPAQPRQKTLIAQMKDTLAQQDAAKVDVFQQRLRIEQERLDLQKKKYEDEQKMAASVMKSAEDQRIEDRRLKLLLDGKTVNEVFAIERNLQILREMSAPKDAPKKD